VRRNLTLLLGAAVIVLAVDLAHKAYAVAERGDALLYHERTLGYVVGVLLAASVWCAALLATRSPGLALAGGILLGGTAGNAASWALWPAYDGTPNPLFLGDTDLGLAFNIADVAVVGAVFVVLPLGLAVFVVRNRHRLREPVRLRG